MALPGGDRAGRRPTPAPTKVALVSTLALVGVALAALARSAGGDELDARSTGYLLTLFTALFGLRVVGQVVVVERAPWWLPPMEQWNLLPYRLLLPIQLAFLGVMAWIDVDLLREDGALAAPRPWFGQFLIAFSLVYAGAMAVRYAIRMSRRPDQRWFGGAIPIVFHVVLASFLLAYGAYHASA